MTKQNSLHDLSMDLQIYRHGNGIKLIKPDMKISNSLLSFNFNTNYSVSCINKFSFNTYFLSADSTILKINEISASTMGFISPKEAVGRTMFDISPIKNANAIINTDREVINTNQLKMSDDVVIRNDGVEHSFLTIKTPWYNMEDKVIGIFGCSILLSGQSFLDAIQKVSSLGLLIPSEILLKNQFTLNSLPLTPREKECLSHFLHGKSAREVSLIFNKSKRTVEKHLQNIKTKLKVNSKSDLIQTVMDNFKLGL